MGSFHAISALVLCTAALLCEGTSAAQTADAGASFDVTSTTLASWHTSPSRYGDLFERLNLAASYHEFQAGARADTATFVAPPGEAVRDRYTLEKVWLGWSTRSVEALAGDSYLSFGRGLALSLRKVDELGVDTTLRGGKLLVHQGFFGGTLAVGYTNINNVDEATGKSVDDPRDIVAAARVEATTPSGTTFGLHGTAVAFRDALGLSRALPYDDRYYQLGATFDAPQLQKWLGVYLEGIAQIRRTPGEPIASPAYGYYALATAYLDAVTVTLEGKLYGDLEAVKPNIARPEFSAVSYNSPPTVERLLQLLENPQRRIGGGRARADWKPTSTLTSFANYGVFHDVQGYADPTRVGVTGAAVIHDPYVGFELRRRDGRSWLLASGGWRAVFLDGSNLLVRRDSHVELDGAQFVGEGWNLSLHFIHDERLKYESRILDLHYREGTLLLALRRNALGSIGAGYDYTTDPVQPKRDYFNGNFEWNITSASSLRLLVGGTRGGLRCMSGVCRVFPPFEGVKLTATLRM